MTVVAGGFDDDGCLGAAINVTGTALDFPSQQHHHTYCCCLNRSIEAHPLAWHFLQRVRQHGAKKVTTFVSSNRQTIDTDNLNISVAEARGKMTGETLSVAQVIRYFTQKFSTLIPGVELTLDKKLLADVARGLKSGRVYDAMEENAKGGAHKDGVADEARCGFEKTKKVLMYMQAHRLAARFPNDTIHFYFYDDHIEPADGKSGFGVSIAHFYRHNTTLLPKNLTIHLCQYKGGNTSDGLPEEKFSVVGSGETNVKHDSFYRQLLKNSFTGLTTYKRHNDLQTFFANERCSTYLHVDREGMRTALQNSQFASDSDVSAGIEGITQFSATLPKSVTQQPVGERSLLLTN